MFGFGRRPAKTALRAVTHGSDKSVSSCDGVDKTGDSPGPADSMEIPQAVEAPQEEEDTSDQKREQDFPALLAQERSFLRREAERTRRLLSVSLLGNLVLALLVGVGGYLALSRDTVYFAATQDLRILKLEPLSKPYISEAGLMNWAANVVTETFTLDFTNYRNSLARVRGHYSARAFKELENALDGTLRTIVDQRLLMYAVCDRTPRLLTHGILDGRYSWRLEVPLTVSLQGASKIDTYRWRVEIVVSRTNVAEKPQGIEVIQVIATPELR